MDQPTPSLQTHPETWRDLDAAVRPTTWGPTAHREPVTHRLGGVIGNMGDRLRSDDVTQKVGAADAVGRAFQRAGAYLDQRDVQDVRADAERLIVKRPLVSIALALFVGYAAGRAIWR
jgi:hypothetical protein